MRMQRTKPKHQLIILQLALVLSLSLSHLRSFTITTHAIRWIARSQYLLLLIDFVYLQFHRTSSFDVIFLFGTLPHAHTAFDYKIYSIRVWPADHWQRPGAPCINDLCIFSTNIKLFVAWFRMASYGRWAVSSSKRWSRSEHSILTIGKSVWGAFAVTNHLHSLCIDVLYILNILYFILHRK